MLNFIDNTKNEIQHEIDSHARENRYIDEYIETIKSHIKEAIRKNQSEYWYIRSYKWIYDDWSNESSASTDREPKDFWTEFEKYKNNDNRSGLQGHEDWDYNYIYNVLMTRLKELGCKDVFLFLGPVKVKKTVVLETKQGFWGTKVKSEERKVTIIKDALRITW